MLDSGKRLGSRKSVYGFWEAYWILGSGWILGKVFMASVKLVGF